MNFDLNVGSYDRIARFAIGIGLIIFAVVTKTWWGLVGIYPLATAVFRFCPAYVPTCFSTFDEPKKLPRYNTKPRR